MEGTEERLNLLYHLLRPALRYCLRNSINVQSIYETLKICLVDLGAEQIEERGEKVTASRLSAMTGLHRRETTRITREGKKAYTAPNFSARIVTQWERNKKFTTKAGKPKALRWRGTDSAFAKLVHSVSKDLKPSAMLSELERLGMAEKDGDFVKLKDSIVFFTADAERGLLHVTEDTDILIRAVEENLFTEQETRNLHIRTLFDNVFKEDIPKIRKWLFDQGVEFHTRAREYLSKFDKDLVGDSKKEGGAFVVLEAFSWTSTEPNVKAKIASGRKK